eukprot:357533-Chlamydomonas_euryale.AAC.3
MNPGHSLPADSYGRRHTSTRHPAVQTASAPRPRGQTSAPARATCARAPAKRTAGKNGGREWFGKLSPTESTQRHLLATCMQVQTHRVRPMEGRGEGGGSGVGGLGTAQSNT